MGLDMSYQALPDDRDWWERVLSDPAMRESFGILPALLRQGGNVPWSGRLGQEADALIRSHPGIHNRRFDLDRAWDGLRFVLSPARRERRQEEDIGTVTILGESVLTFDGKPLTGGQGISLRYTKPATVLEVATFLEGTPDQYFRDLFTDDALDAAGVYKWGGADGMEGALGYFHGLQRFYWGVAERGEGVLVSLV